MTQDSSQERRSRRRRGSRRGHPAKRSYAQTEVPAGLIVIGQIYGAHGLRGEVKVEPYTDFAPERFAPGQSVLIGQEALVAEVATSRPHQARWLVRFEGIESRDEAESLHGAWIYIPEEAAMELDEDTYYVHQILGLAVHSTEGEVLGTVQDVLFTGANEVYVVDPAGEINRGRELLVPAIADVVHDVDLERGVLTVHLPPGLLEESDGREP